ncbi:MAG: hypothetical protein ACRD5H_00015 [Nitrososphaerales archaeon]
MNFNSLFPNKYLAASDVADTPLHAIMDSVTFESLPDGAQKPCVHLRGEKSFILNRTNGMTIAAAYGEETDAWYGKPIILFQETVPFKGKYVPAIRVRIPAPEPKLEIKSKEPIVSDRPKGRPSAYHEEVPF